MPSYLKKIKIGNLEFDIYPSGGSEGLVLINKGDGTLLWGSITDAGIDMESVLAYGVEWDINTADPHLTRIGNMYYHRTLPIQSLLRGCIAQGNKIMYWLDEHNWDFKEGAVTESVKIPYTNDFDIQKSDDGDLVTITIDITHPNGLDAASFFNMVSQENPDYIYSIMSQNGIELGYIKLVQYDHTLKEVSFIRTLPKYVPRANLGDFLSGANTLFEITMHGLPSRLDGYDGTVRVYCPEFYIKSKIIGDIRLVLISTYKVDDTWLRLPAILIDAYKSTVLNTVPEDMGYLSTLPVNSAISVANTAEYCRGGTNRPEYDIYLKGVEASENTEAVEKDIFRTDLGKPRTALSRSTMRAYARNANSELLSYNLYKNIFYWLSVIEFATFNSQEFDLTSNRSLGITDINHIKIANYNEYHPVTPCGYSSSFGSRPIYCTSLTLPKIGDSYDLRKTTHYVLSWRGFENPFGDILTYLEGIILDPRVRIPESTKTTTIIYSQQGYHNKQAVESTDIKVNGANVCKVTYHSGTYDSNVPYYLDSFIMLDLNNTLRFEALNNRKILSVKFKFAEIEDVLCAFDSPTLTSGTLSAIDSNNSRIWTSPEGGITSFTLTTDKMVAIESVEITYDDPISTSAIGDLEKDVKVYVADDPSEYSESIGNKRLAGTICTGGGRIDEFNLGTTAEIFPSKITTNGSLSLHKCDCLYAYNTTVLKTFIVGGNLRVYQEAGLSYMNCACNYNFSGDPSIGFRTVSIIEPSIKDEEVN